MDVSIYIYIERDLYEYILDIICVLSMTPRPLPLLVAMRY